MYSSLNLERNILKKNSNTGLRADLKKAFNYNRDDKTLKCQELLKKEEIDCEKSNTKNALMLEKKLPKLYIEILGNIKTIKPAFVNVIKSENAYDIAITSFKFGFFDKSFGFFERYNEVKLISDIDKKINLNKDFESSDQVTLDKTLIWPNGVNEIDKSFLGRDGLMVCSGFILPGTNNGEVAFIDKSTKEKISIKNEKNGWFYHRAIPFEYKGEKCILTARSKVTIMDRNHEGELVCLKKPADIRSEWKEEVISQGPDINFSINNLSGDGQKQIIAGEFFKDRISVSWEEDGKFNRRIIDENLGKPFDVEVCDYIDKKVLLVTNHQKSGSVFLYEIPENWKSDEWKKHEIASCITAIGKSKSDLAPGKAIPVNFDNKKDSKPYFVVSGDGSRQAYLLIPKDQTNQDSFEYDKRVIFSSDATIGQIALCKLTKDDSIQVFIPLYEKDNIVVLSIKKS